MAKRAEKLPARQPHPRYDLRGAREPPAGFGRVADPSRAILARTPLAIVAVPDPNPSPYGPGHERIQARLRVDLLDNELRHDRITRGAFAVGRDAEKIFGRARGPGSSNWEGGSGRVDQSTNAELACIYQVDDARKLVAYMGYVRGVLGEHDMARGRADAALFAHVLRDRLTFKQCAAMELKFSERQIGYVAARFRTSLEDLAHSTPAERAELTGVGSKSL